MLDSLKQNHFLISGKAIMKLFTKVLVIKINTKIVWLFYKFNC